MKTVVGVRLTALAAALAMWVPPAAALDNFSSGEDLLASMVTPKTLSMLKDDQARTLQQALTLLAIPATPNEFGRMLTVASQFSRGDPQAQSGIQGLVAENAKWMALSQGMPPPIELQTFLGLRRWSAEFPVYSRLTDLGSKPTPFDEVAKRTNSWLRSPFTVQAFRVRQAYVDLLAQERPKADRNVPGARDMLTALLAPGSAAAVQRTDKPMDATADGGKPSCADVLWLPALAFEAGAKRTKDGFERPEVPCR